MPSPCDNTCLGTDTLITMYGSCAEDSRPSGIDRLIFANCAFAFNDTIDLSTLGGVGSIAIGTANDPQSWVDAVNSKLIYITPRGLGEKPGTEKAKKKRFSCEPETTIAKTHVINFETDIIDSVLDATTLTYSDFETWEKIDLSNSFYRVGWIGCDGLIYMDVDVEEAFSTGTSAISNPFFAGSFDIDYIKANDSQTETDKYTFEVTFKERGIVRGYYLPAVIDAIT